MKFHTASKLVFICIAGWIGAAFAWAQSANPPSQQTPPMQQSSATATPELKSSPSGAASSSKYIQVPVGTRLPLVLHNAISTRNAHAGDSVYLETLFPILVAERIVIPAGSYVSGEVTEVKRPGRGHKTGQISIRLDNLILPNGYQAQFNAVPTDAGTGGNETVGREGSITGDSNKPSQQAGTVVGTTVDGAVIGGLAGGNPGDARIGAGLGAAAGLAAILATRNPDAELPRGTTLDVELNRPLYLLSAKINFTSPGQASTLPGPPNRQPQTTSGLIPY
jgi:hypothetical protein